MSQEEIRKLIDEAIATDARNNSNVDSIVNDPYFVEGMLGMMRVSRLLFEQAVRAGFNEGEALSFAVSFFMNNIQQNDEKADD